LANPTTNYGFVLPTSSDLVTDLPADFDVALQGVDTRLKALQPGTTLGDLAYSSATANTNTRLPVGTNGQILAVVGGVPAWQNGTTGDIEGVTAGTGISGGGTSGTVTVTNSMATAIDAKGDLIAGTGADAFARVAVGATNGFILNVDSAESTGMKWVQPQTARAPKFTNVYHWTTVGNTISQSFAPTNNTTYYVPIFLQAGTLNQIAIYTGSGYSGTSTVRLGLYNSDGNNLPTTVAFDAGTVAASAANITYSITISQVITTGFYYLAFNQQASTGTPTYQQITDSSANVNPYGNRYSTEALGNPTGLGFSQGSVTGAFATTTTTTVHRSGGIPIVYVRYA